MAEKSIIREFLVSLGFKVDEPALQKFTRGVTTATKSVIKLGTVVEATAIAVAIGVARFASNLEQLYFAAQRTGSSADQLKAFDLAARNFGSSMEEAQGAVENLAAFLRNLPPGAGNNLLEGWLNSVGLSARKANGEFMQGAELLAKLGQMFQIQRSQGQTFLAHQLAEQIGIPDRVMLAISTPGFQQELERQDRFRKGWEKTAEAAHQFMIFWENFKLSFQQLMFGFTGPAMGAMEKLLGRLGLFLQHHGRQLVKDLAWAFSFLLDRLGDVLNWLDQNGPLLQKRIDESIGEIQKVYEIVKPALIWLEQEFVKLDKATDGWSTKILLASAALKALGAGGIVTGLAGILGAMAKAFGGAVIGVATAAEWSAAGTAFGLAAAAAIGYTVGSLIYHILPESWQRKIGDTEGGVIDWFKTFWDQEVEKFQNWNAQQMALHPRSPDLAGVAPNVAITVNTTVHGSTDPQKTAYLTANENETALKRAAAQIVREYSPSFR